MSDLPPHTQALPPPLPPQLDKVCDRFEAAWRESLAGGPRPRVEEFLAGVEGPHLQILLLELLAVEIAFRRQLNETPAAQEYQERFPSLPPPWLAQALRCDTVAYAVPRTAAAAEFLREESSGASPQPLPAVAGYEILSVLGRGGMGVVYKAQHLALKRTVALKMILAGPHAGEQERRRFKAEAEAVARLSHPNIVQIHEVGEHDGKPFCALEFVEGGSLAQHLRGRPLPPREAARLIETLARAMQLAHSRNVVHRDLKPANILLSPLPFGGEGSGVRGLGTPKVTDFGLARQLDSDSGQTQAGAIMGTPSYMAPEQASGQAHAAEPAADVYALGAILYECLTGRPPFKGANVVETLDQVRSREPVAPRLLRPKVPDDLETVCLKCLAKEPERRYGSAEALADDLRRWQAGEPIAARPVGFGERAVKWVRRRPAVAGLLGVSVVAALSLVVLVEGLIYSSRLEKSNRNLQEAQENLQTLMDHVPDGIYFKNEKSQFVRINQALARRFGLDDPELAQGRTDADFYTEEHAAQSFRDEQEIIRTGQPLVDMEEKETWPDGRETWVSTNKLPLRDRKGAILGTFGVSRDITDRKLKAEELLQALREADVAAGIAKHEAVFLAAGAAIRAGCGQGEDGANLDDKGRAALRQQALSWLQADLHFWARRAEGGTAADRSGSQQRLRRWQQDAALAPIRATDALEKLPEAERAAWQTFWSQVAAVLDKAARPG